MATPRRETMSATAAVENPCCHVSGVDEPAAEKIEKLVSNLWLRRVVSGEKRSRPCKRRDGGAVVPVWRKKMKESSRTKRKMCTRGLDAKLPIKGLSLVIGIISDTVFRKIVSERRIVTPENQYFSFSLPFDSIYT